MKTKQQLLAVLAVCIMSLGLGACAHHDATTTAEAVPGATTIGNDPYNGSATVNSAAGYSSTIGVADPNATPTPTGATVTSPSSATLGGSNTSMTSSASTTDTTTVSGPSLNTTGNTSNTTDTNGSMTSSSTMNDQSDTTSTTSSTDTTTTTTTHRRMRKD